MLLYNQPNKDDIFKFLSMLMASTGFLQVFNLQGYKNVLDSAFIIDHSL